MEKTRTICVGIERVKWSDNAIYISYLRQVYTFPNHRLCSIFGSENVPLIEESYLVRDVTKWQLKTFPGPLAYLIWDLPTNG